MPDTYTQLHYHLVFSTKHRFPLITSAIREELYRYFGGLVQGNGGTLLSVGGMPDHVHLLVGWGTTLSIARILQLVKANSSRWMNERPDVPTGSFAWQVGYGAFTVSASKIPAVRRYILNQEEHHRKVSFEDEFTTLLLRHGIKPEPNGFGEMG